VSGGGYVTLLLLFVLCLCVVVVIVVVVVVVHCVQHSHAMPLGLARPRPAQPLPRVLTGSRASSQRQADDWQTFRVRVAVVVVPMNGGMHNSPRPALRPPPHHAEYSPRAMQASRNSAKDQHWEANVFFLKFV